MHTRELTRDVIVGVSPGISSGVARALNQRIRRYDCKLMIENERGLTVDSKNLFGLLMLGIKLGERVTLRSVGPDAGAAVDEVREVLEG